jgi:hypothetical protein
MQDVIQFPELQGHIFTSVIAEGNSEIRFTRNDGRKFKFLHSQDCCESVYIESITGNLEDLVGVPILHAVETITTGEDVNVESYTKTFYWFNTAKGDVVIRWYGYSNGHYSEGVDFMGDNE